MPPPPPGYNVNTKGVKGGLTQIPSIKPSTGSICGGESAGGKTRNGSPASTYIGTMKPRKNK
jgi:hypothetical protein